MPRKTKLEMLFDKCDAEAMALLKEKDAAAKDDVDPLSIAERVKLFSAVSTYVMERQRFLPGGGKPKDKGKFHDIKQRFHGNPAASGASAANGKGPAKN